MGRAHPGSGFPRGGGRASVNDDRERALALLKQHGWNATSFQILERGLSYWFDGDDACVGYLDTGRAWVAAGAPVAPEPRLQAVTEGFVRAAAAAGRRACFFATEARFAGMVSLASVVVGAQPVWDPVEWADAVKANRNLREQLRRARAKGVVVRALEAGELDAGHDVRRAVETLIERWLGAKAMAPMGFLVEVDPFTFAGERRCFVAELEGRVVGFLAAIPVYGRAGWFLEDILRDSSAPNGTAETLVDAAMRAAAGEGSRYATLGLAPLAGDVGGVLRAARRWTGALYDFSGVHAFKAKLRPKRWDAIYLSFPAGRSAVRAILDSLIAFSRGGLLRFGLETLLRGPAIVVRLLALLLVPWTFLIALPAAAPWFPSPAVQLAWVGFDVLVVVGLLVLTVRWHHWLGTLLAVLITCDAALTLLQGLLYNLRAPVRASSVAVLIVAVSGPIAAAFLLWRARSHRIGTRAV